MLQKSRTRQFFITNTKNYCDTLFRNFELKLWQEPDQEHPKKDKNLDFLYIDTKSINVWVHIHQCDSVLKLDLQDIRSNHHRIESKRVFPT